MAKVTIVPLGSLENQTTFLQTLNDNLETLAAALDNFLSRDGTTPNQMQAELDMNSQRLLNLPSPVSASDPVRLIDLQGAQPLEVAIVPALTGNADKVMSNDGTVLTWQDPADLPGFGDLKAVNNLSELTNVGTARTNLGLGTSATYSIGTSGSNIPVLNGANTWSGDQSFSGTSSFTEAVSLAGTANHRLTATPTALTTDSIGYRAAPVTVQDSNYTFVLGDSGTTKLHTSGTGHSYTIPPASSVNYPLGTVIVVVNTGAGNVVMTRGSGVTLNRIGTGTNANVTIAQWGQASILKVSSDTWVISGSNLT